MDIRELKFSLVNNIHIVQSLLKNEGTEKVKLLIPDLQPADNYW